MTLKLVNPVVEHENGSSQARAASSLRVLHLINGEHYSGAERVQDLLGLRLPEFGYNVAFACLKPDRFPKMRRAKQSPLVEVEMRSRFDFRQSLRLASQMRQLGVGLLHTHTPRAAMIGRIASAVARVPMIHHLHSPTVADSTRRAVNRINGVIERMSLRGIAGIIAVSHSLGQYAERQGFSPDRLRVVPNGVPMAAELKRREQPSGTWTLGTVALFRPRKGLEVLLEAMAILRRQGLDVRLHAVGPFETENYQREIMKKVKSLDLGNLITWTGFTSDVTSELAAMDLFVLPSLFGEGLPMVILEAMAAGVPVVATRVEGAPEAIRDGIDGVIAAPGDPADLARSMSSVIKGNVDWIQMRENAHRRQAEQFSDRSMAEGVAQVYDEVLGR